MIAAVLGLVAAGAVALVISFAVGGQSTSHGCVDVKAPGATGTVELYRCGSGARALCASVGVPAGPGGVFGEALTRECRRAGIPAG